MNTKQFLNTILFLFGSIQLLPQAGEAVGIAESTVNNETWITIFVHGSFSLRPHLSIGNAMRMLYDTLEESVYHRSTEISRRDPFYQKNQPMLGFGLEKIDINAPNKEEIARIFADCFEQISQKAGNKPSQEYYAFGWSGLVSHKLRYIEAEHFYDDMVKIVQEYRDRGITPKIRMIGYSHGGNIILQLGAIFITKPEHEKIYIDELFFLGVPIQVETDYLINSPIFKRVYNIYSRSDNVQQLDFFSFKRFFSRQRFENRRNFEIPDKITQYKIQVSQYAPKKKGLDPNTPIPEKKGARRKLFWHLKYAPGHFELWFMGWTLLTFRKEFPLNPLPIAAFLPLITLDHDQHPELSHDLLLDINTTTETITFKDRTPRYKRDKPTLTRPFLTQEELKAIQEHALTCEAEDYDKETYDRKTANSIKIAREEQRALKRLRRKIRKEYSSKKFREMSKREMLEQQQAVSINLHDADSPYLGHL